MKAITATLIFLFIMTTVFAQEPKVFTDTDLKKYKSSQDEETVKQLENDRADGEKQKTKEGTIKDSSQEKSKDEEELNCYSFHPPGSPYTYKHCRDKSGKITSKGKI